MGYGSSKFESMQLMKSDSENVIESSNGLF